MNFKLHSQFSPAGDQPEAIRELVEGLRRGDAAQTLQGVTGSGKTFTIANVLQEVQRPALVLSHNKTLAAQLYSEFKQFFPENAVEYFVSYYDYYQPEAYIPSTNTYIEKDLQINEEIDKMRLKTTSSLLSGRRDIIVVASVSCIYGIGNPDEFAKSMIHLKQGMIISREQFLYALVNSLYSRTELTLEPAKFRIKGDTVDVFPPYHEVAYRIVFFDNEIENIFEIVPETGAKIGEQAQLTIFPANLFVTSPDAMNDALWQIKLDLGNQIEYLKSIGKHLEAKRLEDRVTYDVEMMKEVGYCSGIENYSRYFDKRNPGDRPFCIIDFFPDDFILVVDESHVSVPQIGAMYGGDRSRKMNLVEYGFRLPAAMDNRPLKFHEFEQLVGQTIFVSATPANYELEKSNGIVVEQIVRPTGLLDPPVEVRPADNQVDDLLDEIDKTVGRGERVLVTTLTKKMAEELSSYLIRIGIRTQYIHSEVETLERVEILKDLRSGSIDVLVGVNLLREGLDLPEVSLVAIMDADKEGFLRNERSLTQTAGRAARHINGRVIFYANKITKSMQATIDETNRRRSKQTAYNLKHNITPKTISKTVETGRTLSSHAEKKFVYRFSDIIEPKVAEEKPFQMLNKEQLQQNVKLLRKQLEIAVKNLDFLDAAAIRNKILEIEARVKNYLSILLLIFFVISCSQPPLKEHFTPNELIFPSNKVGAHFVNYLGHVEYKHQVFEALEVDLIYSSDRNIFYVAHGLADTVGNILFEDWLHQIQNPEKNWFWLDLKNLNQKNAEPIASLLVNMLNKYGIIHQTICENKDVKALAVLKHAGLAVCYWIKQDKFLREVLGKRYWERMVKKNFAYLQPHAISASYLMYPLVTSVFPDANILIWNTPINDINENMEMTGKLCRLPNVKVVIVDYPEPIDYE